MATTDIKVPRRKGTTWINEALAATQRDGQWHLIKTMGVSSAEQTARAYNSPGGGPGWEFGYKVVANNGTLTSELWVRWS
jgi:hypothetical protein